MIDFLVDLARRSCRRLMVRLVKGAYWDSEIKRAQVDGLDDYPVYTRKSHTDVAYLACARRLLAAPAAIYPQFATHNAQTLAAIYEMAEPTRYAPGQYEFQCLHGMGEPLYEQVVGPVGDGRLGRPCRIYAPVGTHETLLAYLVRRLLENGANTSFVNRIADPSVAIDELIEDPVATVERVARQDGGVVGRPHPAIPLPRRALRRRTSEFARARPGQRSASARARRRARREPARAVVGVAAARRRRGRRRGPVGAQPGLPWRRRRPRPGRDPGRRRDRAGLRGRACAGSGRRPSRARAPPCCGGARTCSRPSLPACSGCSSREAGKTYPNGVAEVREAVDFLRFYAAQVEREFDGATHVPLGPVVCISPWNFPLAIFTGQVAAALAAGNPVLAKPAEQTPLVAAEMVRLLRRAGVPRAALQLAPGSRRDDRRRARRRPARAGRDVHRLDRRRAPAAEEPGAGA